MKTALYKPHGHIRVWNTQAQLSLVDNKDVQKYINDGWLDHPSKLFAPAATPTAEPEKPKKKATDNETRNKG